MHTLFIITPEMDPNTWNQQYLLSLAMLNFDHQVSVVFTGDALQTINQLTEQSKQWHGLSLYGADLLCIQPSNMEGLPETTVKYISAADFDTLKNQANFIS